MLFNNHKILIAAPLYLSSPGALDFYPSRQGLVSNISKKQQLKYDADCIFRFYSFVLGTVWFCCIPLQQKDLERASRRRRRRNLIPYYKPARRPSHDHGGKKLAKATLLCCIIKCTEYREFNARHVAAWLGCISRSGDVSKPSERDVLRSKVSELHGQLDHAK